MCGPFAPIHRRRTPSNIDGMSIQSAREDQAILDCHCRSLPQKRQRRMAGIAQERDAINRPVRQLTMRAERPKIWLWNCSDHYLDVVMPPLEIGGQLLAAAHRGPRFGAPVVALYDADKVQQLASSNWILNDMSFRPKPGLGNAIIESGWQFRVRDHASPGDKARELWLVGAMQSGSDDRVNTIRTNQRVSRRSAAVGKQ